MSDLIKRLEAASEGSRELSDEVLEACGWERSYTEDGKRGFKLTNPDGGWVHVTGVCSPTETLDDRSMIIPLGWSYQLTVIPERSLPEREPTIAFVWGGHTKRYWAEAATPALALTIAALKARDG